MHHWPPSKGDSVTFIMQAALVRKSNGRVRQEEGAECLSKMAATIESGNAGAANKKKHLGIPEAIFVVSGNMTYC